MTRLQAHLREVGEAATGLIRNSVGAGSRRWRIGLAIIGPLLFAPALFRIFFQRQLVIDKLQRAEEQCRRADDNLLLAMTTLDGRIDQIGVGSDQLVKVEFAFYKAIYDQEADEPAEKFAQAVARRRAGSLHLKHHQLEQARLCFALAVRTLEMLAAEKPEAEQAQGYRRALAETHTSFAEYQIAAGDITAAQNEYDAALKLLSKLLEKYPGSDELLADQARIWHSRGVMFLKLKRFPEAEADLNRALAIRLARRHAESDALIWVGGPEHELIATWLQLGQLYRLTNRSVEAIALLNEVIAAYAQCDGYKTDLHYCEGYADALEQLAGAYFDDQQLAKSADAYRKALAEYGKLETAYPKIPTFSQNRAQIATRLASLSTAISK